MEKLYVALPSADKNAVLNTIVFMPKDKETLSGIIQICHGMTEHMERYEDFAEYFTAQGYIVFGNDIISHGRSSTTKSCALYFDDWFDTVRDVNTVREYVHNMYPRLPIYIIGFSLGSFIVRSMDDLSPYKKEILIGTGYQSDTLLHVMRKLISIKFKRSMSVASAEVKKLAFDSYNNQFKNCPDNYWLLSDDSERERYEKDSLVNTRMTPKFFCEFLRGMEYTSLKLKNPNNSIPTLFISGEKDPVGDFTKGVNKVFKEYKKNNPLTEIEYIAHATHDILHNNGRSKNVFKDIEKYINNESEYQDETVDSWRKQYC